MDLFEPSFVPERKTLGIIGTAGRGADGTKLTEEHFRFMCETARVLIRNHEISRLVSGGAAWADHVAIEVYQTRLNTGLFDLKYLSLHLPAPWDAENMRFSENVPDNDAGKISNYYHDKFSKKRGSSSFEDLDDVILSAERKNHGEVPSGITRSISASFKGRNCLVASEAQILLAFTFGRGQVLKDGGTKMTWDMFFRQNRNPLGFHCDLNTGRLWTLGVV
jgi:hypothetical protein